MGKAVEASCAHVYQLREGSSDCECNPLRTLGTSSSPASSDGRAARPQWPYIARQLPACTIRSLLDPPQLRSIDFASLHCAQSCLAHPNSSTCEYASQSAAAAT